MIAKYHTSITHDALGSYFSDSILNLISKANVDSDTLFEEKEGVSDNYNVTAQHFNNTSLEEGEDFLKQAEEVAIDSLIEAVRTTDGADVRENYTEAFYNVGRLMHCIQDFYSHTNWINQTGDEVVVWNEDIENSNIENPEDLKTGNYTKWSQFWDNVNMFLKSKLRKGKDYDETYLKADKAVSHDLLNKDEKGTVADDAFKVHEGTSGFDLACEDATEHTQKEWEEIDQALKSELDEEEYQKFMDAMEFFKPTDMEIKSSIEECKENFNEEMGED